MAEGKAGSLGGGGWGQPGAGEGEVEEKGSLWEGKERGAGERKFIILPADQS